MTLSGPRVSGIRKVPDGGRADLALLFRRYARELNVFAFRRLRDREAAAEAVQDRAVRNLTLDFIRRQRPIRPLTDADLVVADPAPSAQQSLEAREQCAVVKATLDEPPPKHRKRLWIGMKALGRDFMLRCGAT